MLYSDTLILTFSPLIWRRRNHFYIDYLFSSKRESRTLYLSALRGRDDVFTSECISRMISSNANFRFDLELEYVTQHILRNASILASCLQ